MASTIEIEKLAAEIGENIYIDVAGWHLYLSDAHLHTQIAEKMMPLIEDGDVDEMAALDVLRGVQVPLGGKQTFVSLLQLVPKAVQQDLVKLLEDYQY
ncbi:hypothetical protein Lepto7376_1787 [[Leptolyngbya] sp. PCC 7376]|uniref:DUF3181 family protein n=1 Tax=[Leptolyngbya] sp. PCC 7376 TaxID=111781 RepID=UPI00029F3C41|nr:DUF3181 family protein [[Leptolyngbya] sp. PCC 7376]AFY38116.1 hypothetical protein Lepto7376_1787 [[Leptolyngbya] sp. PCC 7376]